MFYLALMLSTNLQGPLAWGVKSWTCSASAPGHVLISSFFSSTFSFTPYFSSSSFPSSTFPSSLSSSPLIVLTDLSVQTVHHTWGLNYEQIPLTSGHLYIQWTWLGFWHLSCVHWRRRQVPSGQQRHSRWWCSDRLPSTLPPIWASTLNAIGHSQHIPIAAVDSWKQRSKHTVTYQGKPADD